MAYMAPRLHCAATVSVYTERRDQRCPSFDAEVLLQGTAEWIVATTAKMLAADRWFSPGLVSLACA